MTIAGGRDEAMRVERVAISKIEIGDRRRTQLGAIAKLAESLDDEGQLSPVLVSDDLVLIDGGRRIAAATRLGWKSIHVSRIGSYTWNEIRGLEKKVQNLCKPFTSFEQAREMVQAFKDAQKEVSGEVPPKRAAKGGRPPGGKREASRRTGIDRRTVRDAEAQVAAVEAYPFMKGWPQNRVLKLAKLLDPIARGEIETLYDFLMQPGIGGEKDRMGHVEHFATMEPAFRRETCRWWNGDDARKRRTADSRLAALPPPPYPCLADLDNVVRHLDRALKAPETKAKEELRQALSMVKAALKATEADYQSFRKSEGY